jgi:hypothetical protein
MKYRQIAVGLLVLSLVAIPFISTAAAADINLANFSVHRQGNNLTFSILQVLNKDFDFNTVDKATLTLFITPLHGGDPATYKVPSDLVIINADGLTFTVDRRDLPVSKASGSWVDGYLIGGVMTFEATGPGWTWGNTK